MESYKEKPVASLGHRSGDILPHLLSRPHSRSRCGGSQMSCVTCPSSGSSATAKPVPVLPVAHKSVSPSLSRHHRSKEDAPRDSHRPPVSLSPKQEPPSYSSLPGHASTIPGLQQALTKCALYEAGVSPHQTGVSDIPVMKVSLWTARQ